MEGWLKPVERGPYIASACVQDKEMVERLLDFRQALDEVWEGEEAYVPASWLVAGCLDTSDARHRTLRYNLCLWDCPVQCRLRGQRRLATR